MKQEERRAATRHNLRIPLRFRVISNPTIADQFAESLNLSTTGVYFATDFPLHVGAPVELFLKMPRDVTNQAPVNLRCNARVVRVESGSLPEGKSGVGVYIEHSEAMRAVERWIS